MKEGGSLKCRCGKGISAAVLPVAPRSGKMLPIRIGRRDVVIGKRPCINGEMDLSGVAGLERDSNEIAR